MKVKNCEECNKEFEYEPPKGLPYKRKYSRACSEKKKQEWDSKVDAPVQVIATMAAKEKDAAFYKALTDTSTTSYSAKTDGAKEFHLAVEHIEHNNRLMKCRALECAYRVAKYNSMVVKCPMDEESLFKLADKFVKWIYGR